ncbi:MAG: MotA/TolQ/ExbB proton channel family protein [Labilithrix sp.]|nr:MotA/TolQ/ExbB proton channel family protein [Labilithrix sp.]
MLIERLTKLALLGSSWVLYLLLVLSVISIATMVERWIYFARRSGDLEEQRPRLVVRLDAADLEGLEKLLAADRSLQGRIAREALRWLHGGPEAMADAVDAELSRIRAELERGVNLLGTLGNNAPFIGLFGTVLGVIIAFHSLGESGGDAGAMGGVMGGIAEALVATGVGLFVALPAVVAYNLIQRRIGQIEADAAALVKLISAYAKSDARILERARARSAGAARRRPEPAPVEDDAAEEEATAVAVASEAKG